MKCAEIMTINPLMCLPEDDVADAISLMWDYDCGSIPVVKDMESKELVGTVTDRDIAMCVIKHLNTHHSQVRVADCMSSPVIFCNSEDPIEKALELMSEHLIRRIPIVDENGSCIGIVTQADLLLNAPIIESVIDTLRLISTPYSSTQPDSSQSKEVPVTTSAEA